jgi:hypothetical protein
VLALAGAAAPGTAPAAEAVTPDLTRYSPDCGVDVRVDGGLLVARWSTGRAEGAPAARLALRLDPGRPLIDSLAIEKGAFHPVLRDADPVFMVTEGIRKGTPGRPPRMSDWNEFFDNPASRPHETHVSRLAVKSLGAASQGRRVTITAGGLEVGSFAGEVAFTIYAGADLVHVEGLVTTREDRKAIVYEAGLATAGMGLKRLAWIDTEGRPQEAPFESAAAYRELAVRHRLLACEANGAAAAFFPPPHQFLFPRDWSDNLKYVWLGRREGADRFGIGVRQTTTGGGNYVPWFNAPPGTVQRLGFFVLLGRGTAEDAVRAALRYTNGDRFPALPGRITFTSHWHMAIAVAAMERKARGQPEVFPDLVRIFKEMNVQAVHLGEFHGDGHQGDPGPLRLPEMEAMFAECRRLSDGDLLLIPGEEVSGILGLREEGKHPGHWMSFFPKPIYWIQRRPEGQPFEEAHEKYGKVYRVGGREDMAELLRREGGLAWTAHPRIKASSWTPDIFRGEDFYLADFWLGGAWKAMPADLSRERLGERVLDLLSDMANWGQRKYVVGEVDVFKIDHTHELYGHMNINYLKLDRLPRHDEGWQPVLDALRAGRFFVSTGEVLIPEFTVGGKEAGETLAPAAGGAAPELRAVLRWTFPLRFAEVVSGDGREVHRQRIDLADTEAFGERTIALRPELAGRKWVRFEAWDIAANGAFTQPVWIEAAGGK